MKTIYRMVLTTFILVFLVSVLFFVLVVQLLDLFTNLWRYLAMIPGCGKSSRSLTTTCPSA